MCRTELFRQVEAEVRTTEVSDELQGMRKAGGV